MLFNVWFVHAFEFSLVVLAFIDSSSLRTHFGPFTDVLRKIFGSLTRKVWISYRRKLRRLSPATAGKLSRRRQRRFLRILFGFLQKETKRTKVFAAAEDKALCFLRCLLFRIFADAATTFMRRLLAKRNLCSLRYLLLNGLLTLNELSSAWERVKAAPRDRTTAQLFPLETNQAVPAPALIRCGTSYKRFL
jgi:hypothetical protein